MTTKRVIAVTSSPRLKPELSSHVICFVLSSDIGFDERSERAIKVETMMYCENTSFDRSALRLARINKKMPNEYLASLLAATTSQIKEHLNLSWITHLDHRLKIQQTPPDHPEKE